MFSLKEIEKAVKGTLTGGNDIEVSGVSTDTRTIKKGDIFIALKGPNFNGHNFLNEAFKKGAMAAVISDDTLLQGKALLIKTKDTQRALADIALFYRKTLKIPVIGITGSNGKTTVKDMVAHILSKRFKVKKTYETENNLIGVPLTLLSVKDEDFAVIEMGTNTPGEIGYLANIIRPDIGIITNIGPSHLEGLKNLNDILKEKSALFEHLAKDGTAIINKDDGLLSTLKINKKVLTFGIHDKKCDYKADDIEITGSGTAFVANKKYKFVLQVFGAHNVSNALAAISACSALGVGLEDSANALLDFKSPHMRFDIIRYNGIDIINDAYNSNPLSMKAAIDTLCAFKKPGRKIIAAADMLELGKDTDRLHYETGIMIAKSCADILLTIGKLSVKIADGAISGGMPGNSVKKFKNIDEAAQFLLGIARTGDTILIKGSRAMKMEELLKCFTTSCTR